MIKRPQKAPSEPITDEQLKQLKYPLYGSYKLDGFRCCIVNGVARTSSMKSFANIFTQNYLSQDKFNGLDGEIIVGGSTTREAFDNTSGPIRRIYGEPDFKFYVFDSFIDKHLPYEERWVKKSHLYYDERLVVLDQITLHNANEVLEMEKYALSRGHEGIMIRSPYSSYKDGRCTFREMNIFKRKPFVVEEAIIIDINEAMENLNLPETNELGLTKRSSHAENKFPKGTLGSFELHSPTWGQFKASPGKGFDDSVKKSIWDNRGEYLGKTVLFEYQKFGSKDSPRLPRVIEIVG
jgi:DNA ligase 1